MPQQLDLSKLSDEDLQIYEDLLKAKNSPAPAAPTSDNRAAGQVAVDQTKAVGEGGPQFFKGLPGFMSDIGTILRPVSDYTGQSIAPAQDALSRMYHGVADPLANLLKDYHNLTGMAGRDMGLPGSSKFVAEDANSRQQQEQYANFAGQNATGVAVSALASKVPGVVDAIPSKERAGAVLNQIKQAGANVPIDTSKIGPILEEAQRFNDAGLGPLPEALKKFIQRQKPITSTFGGARVQMAPDPIMLPEGMLRGTAAGRLSAAEKFATKPEMGMQTAKLAKALRESNRGGAAQIGMGAEYDQAVKQYSAAARLGNAADIAGKFVRRAALAAALGAGGTAGYDLYRSLTGGH